jgi:hypothetical protein
VSPVVVGYTLAFEPVFETNFSKTNAALAHGRALILSRNGELLQKKEKIVVDNQKRGFWCLGRQSLQ